MLSVLAVLAALGIGLWMLSIGLGFALYAWDANDRAFGGLLIAVAIFVLAGTIWLAFFR